MGNESCELPTSVRSRVRPPQAGESPDRPIEIGRTRSQSRADKIPVRKPDKFEFIRVHPDPAYRCSPVAFISLRGSGFYIVPPAFRKNLRPREYYLGTLFLATTRLEKPFFWIVTTQSPTGKVCDWYTSALECAERAMKEWVQVVSDQDAGHYAVVVAEDELEAPEWPAQSFGELIKLASNAEPWIVWTTRCSSNSAAASNAPSRVGAFQKRMGGGFRIHPT